MENIVLKKQTKNLMFFLQINREVGLIFQRIEKQQANYNMYMYIHTYSMYCTTAVKLESEVYIKV